MDDAEINFRFRYRIGLKYVIFPFIVDLDSFFCLKLFWCLELYWLDEGISTSPAILQTCNHTAVDACSLMKLPTGQPAHTNLWNKETILLYTIGRNTWHYFRVSRAKRQLIMRLYSQDPCWKQSREPLSYCTCSWPNKRGLCDMNEIGIGTN